jgi:ribosomal protein S18 acetylase RimI-like enzyme
MMWEEEGVKIFQLNSTDASWLSETARRVYLETYPYLWFDKGAWYVETNFNATQLQKELADENALFFGVEQDKKGLGFLKINKNSPLSIQTIVSEKLSLRHLYIPQTAKALELERIYLANNAKGKGIGNRLMELTLNIARRTDKDVVWLKAMDTSIAAIHFYQKMGFEIVGRAHLNLEKMKPILRGMVIMQRTIFEA